VDERAPRLDNADWWVPRLRDQFLSLHTRSKIHDRRFWACRATVLLPVAAIVGENEESEMKESDRSITSSLFKAGLIIMHVYARLEVFRAYLACNSSERSSLHMIAHAIDRELMGFVLLSDAIRVFYGITLDNLIFSAHASLGLAMATEKDRRAKNQIRYPEQSYLDAFSSMQTVVNEFSSDLESSIRTWTKMASKSS